MYGNRFLKVGGDASLFPGLVFIHVLVCAHTCAHLYLLFVSCLELFLKVSSFQIPEFGQQCLHLGICRKSLWFHFNKVNLSSSIGVEEFHNHWTNVLPFYNSLKMLVWKMSDVDTWQLLPDLWFHWVYVRGNVVYHLFRNKGLKSLFRRHACSLSLVDCERAQQLLLF